MSCFNLSVFYPLTRVLMKRVLGLPLANDIIELKTQPQRV
jgi:hypothetical protein